jgi:hypothetical protein
MLANYTRESGATFCCPSESGQKARTHTCTLARQKHMSPPMITHHCEECGNELNDEVCGDHPEAVVLSISTPKRYTWTVEITLDPTLVADGADLTDAKVHEMLSRFYSFAYGHELGARVIDAPDPEDIAKEQGFANAEAMHKARK